MNELQIFNNEEFGDIRTIERDGEPWFVGKDVATALGYERADNAIRNHVQEDDKLMHQISASGQNRQMYIINESGLYALIFGSKLESAKRFKHWVTSEVLPTLRKTGAYKMPPLSKEMQAIVLLDTRTMQMEKRLDKLEYDVTLFTSEATELSRHVRRKGTELLGGKDSPAYKNKVMRRGVFVDIYQQLKREFNICNDDGRPLSYTAMKRKYIEAAHEFLNGYKPSYVQQEMIEKYNRKGI